MWLRFSTNEDDEETLLKKLRAIKYHPGDFEFFPTGNIAEDRPWSRVCSLQNTLRQRFSIMLLFFKLQQQHKTGKKNFFLSFCDKQQFLKEVKRGKLGATDSDKSYLSCQCVKLEQVRANLKLQNYSLRFIL